MCEYVCVRAYVCIYIYIHTTSQKYFYPKMKQVKCHNVLLIILSTSHCNFDLSKTRYLLKN